MQRGANRHGEKAERAERKNTVRGLRRSLDEACDLFLIRRGLKNSQGSFRFGKKR
jgi:hypothetical protein